jgi:hypothetical protein
MPDQSRGRSELAKQAVGIKAVIEHSSGLVEIQHDETSRSRSVVFAT